MSFGGRHHVLRSRIAWSHRRGQSRARPSGHGLPRSCINRPLTLHPSVAHRIPDRPGIRAARRVARPARLPREPPRKRANLPELLNTMRLHGSTRRITRIPALHREAARRHSTEVRPMERHRSIDVAPSSGAAGGGVVGRQEPDRPPCHRLTRPTVNPSGSTFNRWTSGRKRAHVHDGFRPGRKGIAWATNTCRRAVSEARAYEHAATAGRLSS